MDEPTPHEWVVQYLFHFKTKVALNPEKPWLKTDQHTTKWLQFFSGNEDPEGELGLVGGAIITDLETAMRAARILKNKHPKRTFRVFNIHSENIVMADIL
jgi:hypothetical protein